MLRASGYDTRVLVERQGPGNVYRLRVLDGRLLEVVRRQPCSVTGDGSSTIAELIERENRRRLTAGEGVPILPVDLDCVFTLSRAGLGLRSVLPAGTRAVVKTVTSQNRSDENETLRSGLGEPLVAAAQDAMRAVGVRLGGVDLVTADPSRPLGDSGGVIIEVNETPALHYHYQVAERAGATKVAVPVLERLLNA